MMHQATPQMQMAAGASSLAPSQQQYAARLRPYMPMSMPSVDAPSTVYADALASFPTAAAPATAATGHATSRRQPAPLPGHGTGGSRAHP